MVQLVKTDSEHNIYFATPQEVSGVLCKITLTYLASNGQTFVTDRPGTAGDWYVFKRNTWDLSSHPVGMYLLTVTNLTTSKVVATRLAYISPSATEPITTDYDTYQNPDTNVVYQG